jgi:peptidoglycan hydrolase CwlO-like protein
MTNTNEPKATLTYHETPRKNSKNLIIGILAAALIGTAGYLLVDKSKTSDVIVQQKTEIAQVTDEKSDVQRSFDESLARLDSMSGINTDLSKKLTDKNSEIAKAKTEIRSILNKKNATAAELSRAKLLITSLNDKITVMEQEVARLTTDNQTLTQDKVVLTQDKEVLTQEKVKLTEDLTATTLIKEDLTKKVDVASTLNASNIAITPVNVKNSGKEKITSTAKRVDKLMISFDVNNRIAVPGVTDVYVIVTGPDGKPVSTEALGSGTFTTREEGDKLFTAKLPVDVVTAQKKAVQFSFAPGADFAEGNYKIQIYQNGFMIGEGVRELKKGGLFS